MRRAALVELGRLRSIANRHIAADAATHAVCRQVEILLSLIEYSLAQVPCNPGYKYLKAVIRDLHAELMRLD